MSCWVVGGIRASGVTAAATTPAAEPEHGSGARCLLPRGVTPAPHLQPRGAAEPIPSTRSRTHPGVHDLVVLRPLLVTPAVEARVVASIHVGTVLAGSEVILARAPAHEQRRAAIVAARERKKTRERAIRRAAIRTLAKEGRDGRRCRHVGDRLAHPRVLLGGCRDSKAWLRRRHTRRVPHEWRAERGDGSERRLTDALACVDPRDDARIRGCESDEGGRGATGASHQACASTTRHRRNARGRSRKTREISQTAQRPAEWAPRGRSEVTKWCGGGRGGGDRRESELSP